MAQFTPRRSNPPAHPTIESIGIGPATAAAMLGISPKLLWIQTKSGRIPSCKIGRRTIYSRAALERMLDPKAAAAVAGGVA